MPHRSEFYIYKRQKTKASYWYVCYVDPVTGKQGNAKSIDVLKEEMGTTDLTRVKRRDEAVIIAKRALDLGFIGTKHQAQVTFESWCLGFWDYDTSMYIRRRNSMKPGSIGREYANNMYFFIKRNVLPLLPSGILLRNVRTMDLDHVINELLVEKKLSTGTVQLIALSFSVPIREAYRKGLIIKDPTERMVKVVRTERQRGTLTREEAIRLYEYVDKDKDRHERSYNLAIKLALMTGMRSGEVRALNREDLERTERDDVVIVNIRHSVSPYSGLKCTKGKYDRQALIPKELALELIENSDKNGILIPSPYKGYMSSPSIREHFYQTLYKIGISEEERAERNITFHSLRHTFSTLGHDMNVSQEDRMQVMGHRSIEMNDRYTHPGLGALLRVYKIAESIKDGENGAEESAENN